MKRNGPNSDAFNPTDISGSKGGRTKRSSQYMKYFSRYNKAKTGQRLKSTRQHLTLRLSKRSGTPILDGYDNPAEPSMKHLILRMSKKDAVEDSMKHLILRMSKKDNVDDTMKHLLLRMSKKDEVDNTLKHLILRMSKKEDNEEDTLKHLILRMS